MLFGTIGVIGAIGLGLSLADSGPGLQVVKIEPEPYDLAEAGAEPTRLSAEPEVLAPAPLGESRQPRTEAPAQPKIELRVYACPTIFKSSMAPLKRTFELAHPGIELRLSSRPDRDCVGHLLMDTADLAIISTEISPHERAAGLTDRVLGHSIIAMICHPSNSVRSVPLGELDRLLHGRIQTWQTLGGDSIQIQPVCKRRPRVFDRAEQPLHVHHTAEHLAVLFDTTREILTYVANEPRAFGLVELSSVQGNRDVRLLQVSHVPPSRANFARGAWPLGSTLRTVLPAEPLAAATTFVEFLSSGAASALLGKTYQLTR